MVNSNLIEISVLRSTFCLHINKKKYSDEVR